MGFKCKKALVVESVRELLYSWCKRVKEKSKRLYIARSVCFFDEIDETIIVVFFILLSIFFVVLLNEIKMADLE